MRLSQLIGLRFKEAPKDAALISHQFLLRGGYIRQVATGIYSMLPLGKRVLAKIEALIRAEMNSIQGQEISLPVVMPREMWEESGRYASIDASMARFQDRWGKDLVLGMTHEEAVVTLARSEAGSYRQYPFMLYQLQTKFRDETRPRGGLVRVREFTMKDAYSFHRTQECLQSYYDRCFAAYENIFANVGLKNTVAVQSDTGMMGGNVAHEFMLTNPHGEDSLVVCKGCGYAANNEVAVCHRDRIRFRIQEHRRRTWLCICPRD